MTIIAPLFDHPAAAVAAVVGSREISYGELCSDILRAAGYLREQGLGEGSAFGIHVGPFRGPDDYASWVAHLGAIWIGACHATIHDALPLQRFLAAGTFDTLIGQLPAG